MVQEQCVLDSGTSRTAASSLPGFCGEFGSGVKRPAPSSMRRPERCIDRGLFRRDYGLWTGWRGVSRTPPLSRLSFSTMNIAGSAEDFPCAFDLKTKDLTETIVKGDALLKRTSRNVTMDEVADFCSCQTVTARTRTA